MGETGDRTGQIVPVDNSVNPPATHNRVVVIYPYNNEYYLNTEKYSIEASLPAVQSYLEDSYGTNGHIMVSSNDYKQVSLKSVCGWLKLQLTGDGEVVKSITLRGNNGEQVAGELHINTSDATCVLASASGDAGDGEVGGTLVRPGTILTEVTLDGGEGVTLGKNATAFYIALPPQTFEQGFTVEIEDTEGYVIEQSTDKALLIERNTIKPMAAFEFINPATPSAPTPASNEIWYTSSDGNVVTPYKTNVFGAIIISNEYNNDMGIITFNGDVTTIGEDAFRNCYSLTSVNIPDSVTEIGEWAFEGCDSLTEVKGRFAEDNGRILVVDGVLTSFAPAGITEYNIPDCVTTIGYSAFDYCTSLTSVTIPDSVTRIVSYAFCWCDSLTSVTIGDSVTSIGYGAFQYCRSLTSVYCKATTPPVLYGGSVFDNNGSGRKIYVPAGSVEAYKSAEIWSEYADAIVGYDFERDIIAGTQPHNEIWYTSSDGNVVTPNKTDAFGVNIVSNTYADGKGVIVFDGNLTSIGDHAFYYCRELTTVSIPNRVESIGYQAFDNCSYLVSVTIGNRVKTLDTCAFFYCERLVDVLIPASVEKIGDYAFKYCKNLKSVTIGDSVKSIGEDAFRICLKLSSVYCKAITPPTLSGSLVFYDNASDRKIYVPAESVSAYKSANGWSECASSIVDYDF